MASVPFDGVHFIVFSDDHEPAHVHGRYAGVEVIVQLLPDAMVSLAARRDCIRPQNAKRADVKYILRIAANHYAELLSLWERIHG